MLVNEYPIIDTLLEWRQANKFVVSFGDELLAKIEPLTGRLHPTINQIGASSNRMSM
jgi:DNA polymerase I-like protein with 3'-5' exonuclease and polymerase domains